MRKGVRIDVRGQADKLQRKWAFMQFKVMVDHLVDQRAVFAADQALGEFRPLVSGKKVEWNPDKGLIVHIPVLDDFYNTVCCYNRGKFVSLFMMQNLCFNRIIHVL